MGRDYFRDALIKRSDNQLSEIIRVCENILTSRRYEAPDRILDVATAARIAGVSTSTVYRWTTELGLGFQLPSGGWRIRQSQLRGFLRLRGEVGENFGSLTVSEDESVSA